MKHQRQTDGNPASAVRADLERIAERYAAADRRACRAQSIEDYDAAEAERREIAGEFWAAGSELADLLLLLLRHALQHQPDALRLYLAEALRPELGPITAALANLEQHVVALERRRRS
jgi:hypothetical protein